MRNSLQTFGLSLFIVLAFLVIGIGFLFGIDNPIPWIMIAILLVLPVIHKKMTSRKFVSWDNSLSVGITVIDEEHQKLLTLINNLQTAVLYPTGESFERQALSELVDYTKYHFEREEKLMQDNGYPEYEQHKQQHEEMIAKVSAFLSSYEKDREGTVDELTSFLKTWLIDHIAGTDQRYSQFLQDKGVH
ncbi:MAG: bacteriohemerythrin [Candidatus Thiodiazotropha sp. (ex Monitilora ramsayi)]|nr:bacteriohemerythrin [Candidatus Thiodiazotropha sp. (ex Monitilora ramsayi)]